MKTELGLWIDHREAVLVTITAEGEATTRIYSDIEVDAQYSGSSRSSGSQDAENMQDRKYTNNLGISGMQIRSGSLGQERRRMSL